MSIFDFLDLLGTAAFAISGALFAIKKRMDTFGVLIIAFVTAVGGGTLRDMLIGADSITWMRDLNYSYVILAAVILAIIFRKKIGYLSKSLFLFESIKSSTIFLVLPYLVFGFLILFSVNFFLENP